MHCSKLLKKNIFKQHFKLTTIFLTYYFPIATFKDFRTNMLRKRGKQYYNWDQLLSRPIFVRSTTNHIIEPQRRMRDVRLKVSIHLSGFHLRLTSKQKHTVQDPALQPSSQTDAADYQAWRASCSFTHKP